MTNSTIVCEIQSRPVAAGTEVTGFVHSASAAHGNYSFEVVSKGAGGVSNVRQSGLFAVEPDRPAAARRRHDLVRALVPVHALVAVAAGPAAQVSGPAVLVEDAELVGDHRAAGKAAVRASASARMFAQNKA